MSISTSRLIRFFEPQRRGGAEFFQKSSASLRLCGSKILLLVGLFSFFIFEKKAAGQCTLACSQNVQLSLDAAGQGPITAQLIAPNSIPNCPGQIVVQLFGIGNVPISPPVANCTHLGETLSVKLTHVATGQVCIGSVAIHDFLPPIISAPEKFVQVHEPTQPHAIGWATATDNCTAMDTTRLQFLDNLVDLPCTTSVAGQQVTARIDRRWTATDASGNSAVVTQKIWIKKAVLADIVFPKSLDDFDLPALECGQNPQNLVLTGLPKLGGKTISIGAFYDLSIGKSDSDNPTCAPVGYHILRTWTAVDFCSVTTRTALQNIKVIDDQPPVVVCPTAQTSATNGSDCSATVTLPTASATDACVGPAPTIQIETPFSIGFGSNFGPFQGIPLGQHVIKYRAVDHCGNSATCSMMLTVVDGSVPTAIAKPTLQISLPTNGSSVGLPAASFDGGSFDNCQLSSVLVSRDGGQTFGSTVFFSCADVAASPLTIKIKVTDATGNFSIAQGLANVRDNGPPAITCPSDKSLFCYENALDTSKTGRATAIDNCSSIAALTFLDENLQNACGIGQIKRTWRATDFGQNTAKCTQVLTISLPNALPTVVFPADLTVQPCSIGAFETSKTGRPTVAAPVCGGLSINHFDQIFGNTTAPVCFKIARKWSVAEPCSGLFSEKTQWISVIDTVAPELFLPKDTTVLAVAPACSANVFLTLATATDCRNDGLLIQNASPFSTQKGADASGIFPKGVHQIVFSATDGCGNLRQKTMRLEVVCPTATAKISGKIESVSGLALQKIGLDFLVDGAPTKRDTTDAAGFFEQNGLKTFENWTIQPRCRTNWTNGVSTFDLVLISKHILGSQPFSQPSRFIAADANRSGNVSTADIVLLRKLILGIVDSLPTGDAWRFYRKGQVWADSSKPLLEAFEEKMLIQNLARDTTISGFIGVKMGDVNGSADPENPAFSVDDRGPSDGETWPVFVEILEDEKAATARARFSSQDLERLEGGQFLLRFDSKRLRFRQVSSFGRAFSASNFGFKKVEKGEITVSFNGHFFEKDSSFFDLDFDVLEKTKAPAELFLIDEKAGLEAEFYLKNEAERRRPELIFSSKTATEKTAFSIQPNPFSEAAAIHFSISESQKIAFSIEEAATGRRVFEFEKMWPSGKNEWILEQNELPRAGVFFVRMRLETGGERVEKVVFLKF